MILLLCYINVKYFCFLTKEVIKFMFIEICYLMIHNLIYIFEVIIKMYILFDCYVDERNNNR